MTRPTTHVPPSCLPAPSCPPQTDIKLPRRHFTFLEDEYYNSRFGQAIQEAVKAIIAEDKDCRVLNLGAGAGRSAALATQPPVCCPRLETLPARSRQRVALAFCVISRPCALHAGLHAMMALRAGALHVTAAERWLYLALACKESLQANKASRGALPPFRTRTRG